MVHRKGATPAYEGQPLLIPRSAVRSMSRSDVVFKAKLDKAFFGFAGGVHYH